MFKKLKDKLAEEVKSSPQRIQQFAQAAQAAVTSASSSISDITNNDLFSIADNDNPQNNGPKAQPSPHKPQNLFQDVSLTQSELADYSHETENPRQRKLSNSSFASDVSFRLPSYETPSMYHLQSDMEVSASEADDRGFSGGPATLDRVTKEQLYSAYKRTQERYTKYRNQYGDLARHYKLLERENAKARSVLVETQDKALRRISELKEQCALEQSAKAHLEKALRMEIDEKILKIESLNTTIHLLQNTENSNTTENSDNNVQLISLSNDSIPKTPNEESFHSEVATLSNKIEKMEQLLNKYKDNLKISKEKNSQMAIEFQILSNEVEYKNKQIQELDSIKEQLVEANKKIQELSDVNEELQNKINANDFTKIKELSTLEIDLQKANEEINELRSKIEVFSKREEEYAISLAENKLSIHKELESKEAEIKSLKDALETNNKEVQSLKIVINDYKNNISILEEDKVRLLKDCTELATTRTRIEEMNEQLQELSKKCQSLEQLKTKSDEEYKCLQLQLKQETAEKLAMIDRNVYLESRNTQLSEENIKKSTHITDLENEIHALVKDNRKVSEKDELEATNLVMELNMWKTKCEKLESEIQEEREELVKLQTEIEKLLANHELIQAQNSEFRDTIANLTVVNSTLQRESLEYKRKIAKTIEELSQETTKLRQLICMTSNETRSLIKSSKTSFSSLVKGVDILSQYSRQSIEKNIDTNEDYKNIQLELTASCERNVEMSRELEELNKEKHEFQSKAEQEAHARIMMEEKVADTMRQLDDAVKRSQDIESENKTLHKRMSDIELQNQNVKTSIHILESEKNDLNASLLSLKEKHEHLLKNFENVTQKQKELVDQIDFIHKENEELKKSNLKDVQALQQSHALIEADKAQYSATVEQLQQILIEKDALIEKLTRAEEKNKHLNVQLRELNVLQQTTNEELCVLKDEMSQKYTELEKYKQNQASLEMEIAQHLLKIEEISKLEQEKTELNDENKIVEDKFKQIESDFQVLKQQLETSKENNDKLNSEFIYKSEDYDRKIIYINDLKEKNDDLSDENIKLKSEVANFTSNILSLESEINDIKTSHKEIELEKNRLNDIIEKLGCKDESKISDTKGTQTEENNDAMESVLQTETSAMFENKWILENKQTAMANTASLNLKTNMQDDIIEQYAALKISYDSLKDDNKRLNSDIEGLQSYLTKISKENSVLNDKLREVIATSEHSMDNDEQLNNINQLINELQIGKEKINDLQRENSLLVEENLELKDQLHSQSFSKPLEMVKNHDKNDTAKDANKEQYNKLLQTTSEIKKRNLDLEQINRSVSGNITQLQEKNEKLKLSNEKLERRLDEALVSLRHLHSLQENTELEYLRNILYEYLTGSGTHSVTLAKVLAAIVKFDDMQTQMVLQKEKERQGFLRQLGII